MIYLISGHELELYLYNLSSIQAQMSILVVCFNNFVAMNLYFVRTI